MENNFYNVVKNNGELERELKRKRRKEEEKVEKIIQKQSYSTFKFVVKEFSCFINEVVKNYADLNTKLTNMTLDDIKITYSNYDEKNNREFLNNFLKDYDLGLLKDDYIVWNSKKTIKDFIDAYNNMVHKYEKDLYISSDLREKYLQLVARDKKEYDSLLTDKFKKFLETVAYGIDENISSKLYYYIQTLLEERNYDLQEFDTRDYSDFYENPNWDKWNPDCRVTKFLSSVAKMGTYIDGELPIDVDTLNKEQLEKLINDINNLVKDERTGKLVRKK